MAGSVTGRSLSQLVFVDSEIVEIPAFTLNTGEKAIITSTITASPQRNVRIAPMPFSLLLFEGATIDETKMVGVGSNQTDQGHVFTVPQPLPNHPNIDGSDGSNAVYRSVIYFGTSGSGGSIISQTYCGIAFARVLLPVGGEIQITNEVEIL